MNQLVPGAAIRAGLLLTVVASLVVPAMIAGLGNSASAQGVRHFSVDADGRTLEAACVGSGGPTFIQEIGGPDPEGGVASIQEAGTNIPNRLGTSACGYDRVGTSQSEIDGEEPRSYEAIWQEQQVQLAEALGVEVEVAEHTGHVIAGENPQLVVDVVLRVIAETETEAPGTPSPATPTA